ncbi:MAG: ATP-dependent helicase [Nitrospirae bacterium]|nr:ATP-dependent helicase [Candidatus Manganitrophaceae bacterium]
MTDSAEQTSELHTVMDQCFNLEHPKSFFLFAGAGSGKTHALVEGMKMFRKKYGQEFHRSARKVAVITYTNAACDEIKHRIDYDSIFSVSTIHSFAWALIQTFDEDIRKWLKHNLQLEIMDLEERQQRGRTSQASIDRAVKIASKQKRLGRLATIKHFTYNPNGENIGKNSLNHTEVIGIAADFLTDKPLMQRILIRKYPVLLVDESQDTQKDLIDAFFTVQREYSEEFCLALFGDTMQRIYSDGKTNLEKALPQNWAKPAITINYRCPKRIVRLINKIRSGVDKHIQEPAKNAPEGFVRLFLVQDDGGNKATAETEIAKMMAKITSDQQWSGESQDIKMLTLEHHMAARRGGFSDFFIPLYQVSKFKTGLLNGTLSGIPFFSQQVFPLVKSLQAGSRFAVARIIKKDSPLVSPGTLKKSTPAVAEIRKAHDAVNALFSLWKNGSDPSLIDSLVAVTASGLFAIPDVFTPIVSRENLTGNKSKLKDPEKLTDNNPDIDAWDKALSAPFSQLERYIQYITDKSPFGTHQGIKGLEFPRVMVVLDDHEARGFMFSYDKLFGAKAPTSTDRNKAQEGRETALDKTRRLFYVTCSRAQSSLALVVYTNEKDKIREHLQRLNWFSESEIVDIGGDSLYPVAKWSASKMTDKP